jgi:hypothetical protein
MDNAVALVQAYLRVNGYFTIAEYPVIEALEYGGYRAVTDLDILAFRFPRAGRLIPGAEQTKQTEQELFVPDPKLGIPVESPDMIIGEVKEGRAEFNRGTKEPEVIRVALRRFGCCTEHEESSVRALLEAGQAELSCGYNVRLVAFGTSPPDSENPKYHVILLQDVTDFLNSYIRDYWDILHHAYFKDPAFGFLVTLEKARRAET